MEADSSTHGLPRLHCVAMSPQFADHIDLRMLDYRIDFTTKQKPSSIGRAI